MNIRTEQDNDITLYSLKELQIMQNLCLLPNSTSYVPFTLTQIEAELKARTAKATNDIFARIGEAINPNSGSNNKTMPLAAIWITPAPVTEAGRQSRITEGTRLKVIDCKIVDLQAGENPTHIVTSCSGNISGTVVEMVVMDLKTQDLIQINL